MKYVTFIILSLLTTSSTKRECIKWNWTGDVYNRKVICLEWRDKEQPNKNNKQNVRSYVN